MDKRDTASSLSRKLLLIGALPVAVMFVVLVVFFTSVRMTDASHELTRNNQVLADSLAPALEYAMVSGNSQVVDQLLSSSLRYSHADWIRVSDIHGNQIGFASRNGVASDPVQPDQYEVYEAEILQQAINMHPDTVGDWFEPESGITATALSLGSVQVGVSTGLLADRRQDILWTSLLIGISLLTVTILVIRYYINTILAPIQQISGRIEKLIQRDYSIEPVNREHTSREVLDIEHQLNELAVHLGSLISARDQIQTDSELARVKAEEASSSKSEFLATMSHELRTPLNAVLGMIDQIGEEPLTETQQQNLTIAREATEDFLTVISDILDYTRLDGDHVPLESQAFDLRKLINNCTATYRHVAEQQKLELSLSFFGEWPEKPLVIGDAGRLRQILAGLIDNAIKYTADGFIEIQAGCFLLEDNFIALNCAITDSGSGIPIERLQDIFNTFEQVDSGDSRAYGGTGLGLSLVQRLVEILGGHIQVETDLGKGSSFRFEVPFELDTESLPQETQAPVSAPREPDPDAARALVIEDNPVNQRVAATMLTRLGFVPDTARDGREALELVKDSPYRYAVVLMDCQMPVMDGYETTRRLRQWEHQQHWTEVPVIALTADASPATEKSCLSCGMNDYLTKPVRKETLQVVLSRWLEPEQ